jgi:hypothetical protein
MHSAKPVPTAIRSKVVGSICGYGGGSLMVALERNSRFTAESEQVSS